MQDLLNNPPTAGNADPAFVGRDWHTITVGELVNEKDVKFVEVDTGIEEATHVSRLDHCLRRPQGGAIWRRELAAAVVKLYLKLHSCFHDDHQGSLHLHTQAD